MKINTKEHSCGQRMSVHDIICHVKIRQNNKDAFLDVAGNLYLIVGNYIFSPITKSCFRGEDLFYVHHFCDVEINEL
jgi:hypothetical protein